MHEICGRTARHRQRSRYGDGFTEIVIVVTLCFVDDVLVRMMEEKSGETCRTLYGHSGPVYHLSFSPDRTLLLSCSEDTTGTIRRNVTKINNKIFSFYSSIVESSGLDVSRRL